MGEMRTSGIAWRTFVGKAVWVAVGVGVFLALMVLPWVVGSVLDFWGRREEALQWLRRAPAVLVSDSELLELASEVALERQEREISVPGAVVRFDPGEHDEAAATEVGVLASQAGRWAGERIGVTAGDVPVRLPRWRNPELLGAYDLRHVNLSGRAMRDRRVVAHEVTHFVWYERMLSMPGLPVASPLWVEEGLAEYVGRTVAGSGEEGTEPIVTDIDGLDRQVHGGHDYRGAASFVAFLVRTLGWERFRGFLSALSSGSITFTAMGRGFGVWPEDLVEAWGAQARFGRGHNAQKPRTSPDSAPPASVRSPAVRPERSELASAVGGCTEAPALQPKPGTDFLPPRPAGAGISAVACALLAVLLTVTGRAAGRKLSIRGLTPRLSVVVCLALPLLLVLDRLVWGVGLEVAAVTPGFEWASIPILWRHRMLWLFDTAILGVVLIALLFLRGSLLSPGEKSRNVEVRSGGLFLGGGLAVALLAGLLAMAGGRVTVCPSRAVDGWLIVCLALAPVRAWIELSLFSSLLPRAVERPGRGAWSTLFARFAGAVLYAVWTHGPRAGGVALASRALLFLISAGAPGGFGFLAGWDIGGGVLVCREAMAPAKLGLLRNASLDAPLWDASGLDGWLPAAVMGIVCALVLARARPGDHLSVNS